MKKKKRQQKKNYYISLYAVKNIDEIEDQIFRQLHPVLSSKPMALAGKIVSGILRSTIQVNLDTSTKATSPMPDIQLPGYLRNTNDRILVFDDLERCQISVNELFGYINSFVEHKELKVVLIANENELLKKDNYETKPQPYNQIKEKLIGKTFKVDYDIDSALDCFLKEIDERKANKFKKKIKIIQY